MSTSSFVLSVVARSVQAGGKLCQEMSYMHEEHTTPSRELMLQSALPSHPWEKVGADLFQLKDSTYLVVVDYYSRYMEIQKLTSLSQLHLLELYLCLEREIFLSRDTSRAQER